MKRLAWSKIQPPSSDSFDGASGLQEILVASKMLATENSETASAMGWFFTKAPS
jgi:hypothetical protein